MQRGWLDALQDVFLCSGTVSSPIVVFFCRWNTPPCSLLQQELGGRGQSPQHGAGLLQMAMERTP